MPFTAVVVTWNSVGEVEGLIGSLQEHLGSACRMLVVDNASTDGTVEAVRRLAPDATVIALDENVGFGPANNIGVRAAETDVVALLNPDTLVVDDSLAALAGTAAGERALFAPRLLNEDGSVQISAWPALVSPEALLVAIWPGALLPGRIRRRCEPWRYEERLPAGWLTAACLVARRDLLLEFGPFDERLVLYGEDGDLCIRAWRAGVPSLTAADVARVVHLGGARGRRPSRTWGAGARSRPAGGSCTTDSAASRATWTWPSSSSSTARGGSSAASCAATSRSPSRGSGSPPVWSGRACRPSRHR